MSLWRRISYDHTGKAVIIIFDKKTSDQIHTAFLRGDIVTKIIIPQKIRRETRYVPHNFFFDTFNVQNLNTAEVFYFDCIPQIENCKWFDESCNSGNNSLCHCYHQLEIWPETRPMSRFQSWCRCTDTSVRFFYADMTNGIAYKVCLAQNSPCYENNTITKIVRISEHTNCTPITSKQIENQINDKHSQFVMLESIMKELEKSIDLQFGKYGSLRVYTAPELDTLHRSNIDFKLVECNDECCICLADSNTSNDDITERMLELCRCKHRYHVKCISGWIKQGKVTCPLCRQSSKYRNIGTQPAFDLLQSSLGDKIDLRITFPNGIQSEHDPFPGSSYYGTIHKIVTNNNPGGNMLIRLFNKALYSKVLFNIVYQDGVSFVKSNLPSFIVDPLLYVESIKKILLDNDISDDDIFDYDTDYDTDYEGGDTDHAGVEY